MPQALVIHGANDLRIEETDAEPLGEHQLRVHMQSLGHPMLGDSLYAPPEVLAMSPRLMLHAQTLALAHPFSQAPLSFELPVAWAASAPYQAA